MSPHLHALGRDEPVSYPDSFFRATGACVARMGVLKILDKLRALY